MIFSELYSAYYNTVASIIKAATDHLIDTKEIQAIIDDQAFGESFLNILPAINEERWQVINPDGTTNIRNKPAMPLTLVQKRWLKAISIDPRIRLFTDDAFDYQDVKPLFTMHDYIVFDRYSDGDPYEDTGYIERFRMILNGIRERKPLCISLKTRKGRGLRTVVLPVYLEYSEKDDKFRLFCSGKKFSGTINLGRIESCSMFDGDFDPDKVKELRQNPCCVTFELIDERNALERVLLHFAHFEKEAEKQDEDRYLITIWYDKDDETEMVIRILSFGPMIKVVEPLDFIKLIRNRLEKQRSCGL